MLEVSNAEKRYGELENHRSSYLRRARDSAKLTIPSLMPESRTSGFKLPTPYQGIGARGLNNLASKLLLTLFPPNSPFFRMMVDTFTLKEMGDDPALKTKIEKALGEVERSTMSEIETVGDRVQLFEALKQLIVAGNVLLFIDKTAVKVFHLDRYVVKRDPMGNVSEIITREFVSPDALPRRIQEQVKAKLAEDSQKTVAVYTHIQRKGNKVLVVQQAKGIEIPGSQGSYPVDKTPWLALRFTRIDGEDYGRGFIEEYYGDLVSLEKLTKALVEGAAAAAKVLFLVNPNGTTRARTLAKAPNGSIREGDARDISVLQLDKFADFRVTRDVKKDIEERLASAFLLNSSIQRNGERVTAEEIRYMAGELEDALGGVYSILSMELQLPYVNRRMAIMQRQGRLPSIPKDLVKPSIVTGLEALGRGHDLRKLQLLIQGLREDLGDAVVTRYINVSDYISRKATAIGIDTEGLVKTEDELKQADEAEQYRMMIEKLGPEAMKQMGGAMQQGTPE